MDALQKQLQSKPLLNLCLNNLREIEASGSERMMVDVEQVSRVPPPTDKNSEKTKTLYKKFLQMK